MKQSNAIISTAAAVAVIATLGIAGISAMAQDDEVKSDAFRPRMHMGLLTDAEKEELNIRREEKLAEREARRGAVEAAIEANDYNAWVEAIGADSPMAGEVSQEEFPKLVEAHKYREEARALMEEIGFTHEGKGFGHRMGWHK